MKNKLRTCRAKGASLIPASLILSSVSWMDSVLVELLVPVRENVKHYMARRQPDQVPLASIRRRGPRDREGLLPPYPWGQVRQVLGKGNWRQIPGPGHEVVKLQDSVGHGTTDTLAVGLPVRHDRHTFSLSVPLSKEATDRLCVPKSCSALRWSC